MIKTLLTLVLAVCLNNSANAFQSTATEQPNVHNFANTDELLNWFDSKTDSNQGSKNLVRNEKGQLISVRLTNTTATDGNIELVTQFGTLRHIKIKCSNRLSTAGIRHLSKLKSLEHLELGLVYGKLPDDIWAILAELPKLKKIEFAYVILPDSELSGVEKLSALQSIGFRNTEGMTRESCQQLSGLDGLRSLHLVKTSLKPSDLSPLDRLNRECSLSVEFKRQRSENAR